MKKDARIMAAVAHVVKITENGRALANLTISPRDHEAIALDVVKAVKVVLENLYNDAYQSGAEKTEGVVHSILESIRKSDG